MNTTVTIQFSNGESREFVASDQLEEMIQQGHMLSVTTLHPATADLETEKQVSKMYAGNPVAALGQMMMLRDEVETSTVLVEVFKQASLNGINACIEHLSLEITSHKSNMTPLRKH
jgi:hypothetical protein